MPKLVMLSVLLVVVLGYAMAFVSWNSTPVTVVGFRWGGEAFWQTIPTAYLPLIGVGIGVVAMALACLSQWSSSRGQLKKLSAQVEKAREVIEFQKKRISELEASIEQLKAAQTAKAGEVPPEQPDRMREASGEPDVDIELLEADGQPAAAADETAAQKDDSEVI